MFKKDLLQKKLSNTNGLVVKKKTHFGNWMQISSIDWKIIVEAATSCLYANELLVGEDVTDFKEVKDKETLEAIREESLLKLGYFLQHCAQDICFLSM